MKITRKRVASLAVALGVSLVGGAFAYHNLNHGEHREPSRFENELLRNGSEIVVRAYRIDENSLAGNSRYSFTGTLQPRYQTPVGFRVAGKIAKRHVEVGERVQKGDLLFELDPIDFDLQLRVAEADLVSAQSMVKQATAEEMRLSQLRLTGSVSQSDYDLGLATRDVAIARLDSAQKRLELARNQREYCRLLSDSDGLITAISGEAGQVVNIGQPIVQIMQGDELEAVINLPENRLADIGELKAEVAFWSNPNKRINAQLRELSPIADPLARTYDAKFKLRDAPSDLAIGMTTTVFLQKESESGITIPITSLASSGSSSAVWKINRADGSLTLIPVHVLQYRNETAQVRGELHVDDWIVSAGVQRLDASVRVRIWDRP